MFTRIIHVCLMIIFSMVTFQTSSQQTVGLFSKGAEASPGYNLLFPLQSTSTYLIDNCGHVINEWESGFFAGNTAYLLENGDLLRAARVFDNFSFFGGGSGGRIEKYDWNGNLLWHFEYSSTSVLQHHDIEYLPNGNILLIAWELKTDVQAIAAGRDPATINSNQLWPDHIVEIMPMDTSAGQIVWEWHMWDHLIQDFDSTKSNFGVVEDHPELLNLNFAVAGGGADWMHSNAVDYNEDLDQILLSSRATNEIYIIDHSTTSLEAAGHSGGDYGRGGDILYRWGNPMAYQKGDSNDQQLFGQHDAHWIPEHLPDGGKIMVFNNGVGRSPIEYSSVDIVDPPRDSTGFYVQHPDSTFGPETAEWSYNASIPTDFFAGIISGAQRMPNGNTLICNGTAGRIFEIDGLSNMVWDYVNPVIKTGILAQEEPIPGAGNPGGSDNLVFRCYRYAPDDAAFIGKDLTPGNLLELDPYPDTCHVISGIEYAPISRPILFPVPADRLLNIVLSDETNLIFLDVNGQVIFSQKMNAGKHQLDISNWDPGVYFCKIGQGLTKKLIVL